MKYDFCTLTDKNFVYKWLALCNSIEEYAPGSKIWVLCLDEESAKLIKKLNKKHVQIVRVSDLSDKELEKRRAERTKQEFAWTCKPAIMNYVLAQDGVTKMIFADSDILFYSSVDPLFQKHKDVSVMLTSHKFSKEKSHLADIVGYYNSGFIIFRNDEISRACVLRYKNQCIDWCFNYHDNGRHGDQSYLKSWPNDFKKIEEIPEKGVNLGTWNLERYKITEKNGDFYIDDEKLICYHFHGYITYLARRSTIKSYPITVHHRKIYAIYLKELQNAYNEILKIDPSWEYGFAKKLSFLRKSKQEITQKVRTLLQKRKQSLS